MIGIDGAQKLGEWHHSSFCRGASQYQIPVLTEHVETNLWLVESTPGVKTRVNEDGEPFAEDAESKEDIT